MIYRLFTTKGECPSVRSARARRYGLRHKLLNIAPLPVSDIHIALAIDRHMGGFFKLSIAGPFSTKLVEKFSIAVKYLHAKIALVGNKDPVTANGNTHGPTVVLVVVKLPRSAAFSTPMGDITAGLRHLHDMAAAGIEDIEVILCIDGNPVGACTAELILPEFHAVLVYRLHRQGSGTDRTAERQLNGC